MGVFSHSLCASKMKNLLFLIIIFCCANNIEAQNIYYGIKNGLITHVNFGSQAEKILMDNSYSVGLVAEYIPNKAMFSVTAEIQYLFEYQTLLLPISLNLIPGKKIKFRILGGIVPLARINPVIPNKTIGIGAKSGIGIDLKLNQRINLNSDIAFNFIPYQTYHYMHFGPAEIDRNIDRLTNINIGIQYSFKKK